MNVTEFLYTIRYTHVGDDNAMPCIVSYRLVHVQDLVLMSPLICGKFLSEL